MRAVGLLLSVGLLAAAAALGAPRYVIEQLVLGVSTEPAGAGERIGTIRSGESVEQLERQGEFARVRLGSGREGWVKASYLSEEPPLRAQLEQQSRETARLREELERLRAAASQPPPAERAAASVPIHRTNARSRPAPGAPPWPWVLGGSLCGLLVGFALGWRVLDLRIRRRYGGLKIY